jgi:hypothetical protein
MTTATGIGRERLERVGAAGPIRQHRRGWAALAVMLMIGMLTLGAYLYQRAGAKTPVVVMARTVAAEHVITRADLSTVSVAGPLKTVAAADLGKVVGRRAAVTMLAGTPVQVAMLSSAGELRPGQAQVGLAVTSGQMPADGVRVGDSVEVLHLPGSSTAASSVDPAQVLVAAAPVWAARSDPTRPGGMLLTVTVPADVVSEVVSASGAGQVAVVRVVTGG